MGKPPFCSASIWLTAFLVAGAVIGSDHGAAAQSVNAPGAAVIRFGVPGGYPPFAAWSPGGDPRGADVEIAKEVARGIGANAVFVRTTWSALAADFSDKRFDVAIGGISITPERAALGVFGPTLVEDGKRPLARCADRDRYPTLIAINRPDVRVEISQGPEIQEEARRWFSLAKVVTYSDAAVLTQELLASRVDVWITDGPVVDQMARRYPGQLCATTDQPFTRVAKAWLMQNQPGLVAEIDDGLKAAIKTGDWKRAIEAEH